MATPRPPLERLFGPGAHGKTWLYDRYPPPPYVVTLVTVDGEDGWWVIMEGSEGEPLTVGWATTKADARRVAESQARTALADQIEQATIRLVAENVTFATQP